MKLTNKQAYTLGAIFSITIGAILWILFYKLATNKIKKEAQITTINTINKKDSSTNYKQLSINYSIENLELKHTLEIRDRDIVNLINMLKAYDKCCKEKSKKNTFIQQYKNQFNRQIQYDSIIVTKKDTIISNPIYESQFNLGWDKINNKSWVEGSTIASSDTTLVDLIIHNDYKIYSSYNKKDKTISVLIKNFNPYIDNDTVTIITLNIPNNKKCGFGRKLQQWMNIHHNKQKN